MLGRFPRRNRFISDYIFDKTGKRRTPKQVGSRLQQLRESCGGNQRTFRRTPVRPLVLSCPISQYYISSLRLESLLLPCPLHPPVVP
jgi:transcriptional enhancer factor